GDVDLATIQLHPLRDAEPGAVPLPALEAGIAGTLGEEVTEGPMQILQGLLERLRINLVEPGRLRLLLQRGQLGRKLLQAEGFAGRRIVVFPAPQGPVPDEAAGAGCPTQVGRLSARRLHAEAIGLALDSHDSIPRRLFGDVAPDGLRGDV